MAEIKSFKNASIKIDKEKGLYTGEAINSLISPTPEGYGTASFANNKITLTGQFKNGSFVNGDAQNVTTKYHGSFDNFNWLGGGDGVIEYANGDYCRGSINPISKKLEITDMLLTDNSQFHDSLRAKHVREKDDTVRLLGTQTLQNGSTITGTFECGGIKTNILSITHTPPQFYCTQGQCHIIIQDDDTQKVEISGNYLRDDLTQQISIDGVYTLNNKIDGTSLICNGVFDFERFVGNDKKTFISEKFGGIRISNDLGYNINLVLRTGGKIKLKTPSGSFVGEKISLIQDNVHYVSTYSGTMTNKSQTISSSGTFDSNLTLLDGEIKIKTDSEIINFAFDRLKINHISKGNLNYSGEVRGTYLNRNENLEGLFTTDFNLELDKCNLAKEARLNTKPTQICGKIQHRTESGAFFEGELLSMEQRNKDKNLPQFVRNPAFSEIYTGNYYLLNDQKEYIFNKSGVFSENYQHEYGKTYMQNALGKPYTFTGEYDRETGFRGTLSNPENNDYQSGEFDSELEFVSGKFRKHYHNSAIFEGETSDLQNATGILSRKGDFVQKGKFEIDGEMYPTLISGDVLVYFDDEEKTYCEGKFDLNGIKLSNLDNLPLFGDNTYLLNFKNKRYPQGEPIVSKDLTEAYTQFLLIAKFCKEDIETLDSELASTTPTQEKVQQDAKPLQEVENSTQTAEQIINKYTQKVEQTQQNTQESEQQSTETSAKFTDMIDIAGKIIDTRKTDTQPFDMAAAQNLMSKLTNPNKEPSQNKE